jgi:sigma-E factor negative regulatory protein RseA
VTTRHNTLAAGSGADEAWREELSALADGELPDAAPLCSAWLARGEVRETWHTYHLIGDVLRSDDLAASPGRDAALLGRLRECLACEPAILAPAPLAAAESERRWSLRAAVAVTAGVVAVGGIYSLMRPAAEPMVVASSAGSGSAVAPREPVAAGLSPAVAPAGAESDLPRVIATGNMRLIRDARLDAYLAAHKQFPGSSALGIAPIPPRGSLVETTAPGR